MKPALRRRAWPLAAALLCGLAAPGPASAEADPWPPSPYSILGIHPDRAPGLDVVAPCLPQGGTDGPEAELARAISRARASESADSVVESLLRTLAPDASPQGRACAEFELARLRLRAGFLPETRLHAGRARRAFATSDRSDPADPAESHNALLRAEGFYRAESFYRSDEIERAEAIYRELAGGTTPVARAAALRLADIAYVNHGDLAGRLRTEELLVEAAARGMDVSQWSPRLAEWWFRDDASKALGLIEQARATFDGATFDGVEAEALALRHADLLYHVDAREEGRDVLRALMTSGRHVSTRQLAGVRLVDLERRREQAALRQLQNAAKSELPGLRAYARGVLARSLIRNGAHGRALEILVRLMHDGSDPDGRFVPKRSEMFDDVALGLTNAASCEEVIAAVGGRRDLLMRYSSKPGPFLVLGDCYLAQGLSAAALATYRGAARTFGPSVIHQLTLRTARAQYGVGRIAAALAAARGSVARNVEPIAEWRLLYGEILLHQGHARKAVEALEPVWLAIERDPEVGSSAYRALLLSARAALGYRASASLRERLRRTLAHAVQGPGTNPWLAEAALLVADLHRAEFDLAEARELYARAFATLAPGYLRSRAGYWHGTFARDEERARDIWSEVAQGDDSWARLAANEIALSEGRMTVGLRRPAPGLRVRLASRSHDDPEGRAPGASPGPLVAAALDGSGVR